MDKKTMIRARHFLKFKKNKIVVTSTGIELVFVRSETLRNNITHYIFEKDGRYFSFKMNVYPYLQVMGVWQSKRDELGVINCVTFDYLLNQLIEIKKLRIFKSVAVKV